ncbi:MAG TPA: hypothetical protein VND24_10535 [Steroidobacteraceae bacterium]|nr:hypothetical protein [Steroidobacteraceae bacterium]
MDVTISRDEQMLLVSILQDTLGDVREQVYKAELSDYKEELRQKETLIRGLLARLGAPVQPA